MIVICNDIYYTEQYQSVRSEICVFSGRKFIHPMRMRGKERVQLSGYRVQEKQILTVCCADDRERTGIPGYEVELFYKKKLSVILFFHCLFLISYLIFSGWSGLGGI